MTFISVFSIHSNTFYNTYNDTYQYTPWNLILTYTHTLNQSGSCNRIFPSVPFFPRQQGKNSVRKESVQNRLRWSDLPRRAAPHIKLCPSILLSCSLLQVCNVVCNCLKSQFETVTATVSNLNADSHSDSISWVLRLLSHHVFRVQWHECSMTKQGCDLVGAVAWKQQCECCSDQMLVLSYYYVTGWMLCNLAKVVE